MPKEDPLKFRVEELFSSHGISEEDLTVEREKTISTAPLKPSTMGPKVPKKKEAQITQRIRELNFLNELERRIDERPKVQDFLTWVAQEIPSILPAPEQIAVAITYNEDIFGDLEAISLGSKISEAIQISNRIAGYIFIANQNPKAIKEDEKTILSIVAGRVAGYLENMSLFDQTERQSKELMKFKKGIDLATDAVFITNLDGEITYINKSFEKIYGYSHKEAIGKTPRLIKSGLISQDHYQRFWQTLLAGEIIAKEIINKTKEGRLITVDTTNIPVLDDKDELIGFLALHKDVSKQKRDEYLYTKRSDDLEAVAQLSMTLSAILDPNRLLQTLVDLSKKILGLDYVQIYLTNETDKELTLVASSGEIGKKMVEDGWKIEITNPSSIVARAASEVQGIVANDLQLEPGFITNNYLPESKSELAVPILLGDIMLGVMDVHSDQVNYFTKEDLSIQTALAGQIAVALQNARQYQETQTALAHSEALLIVTQAATTTLDSKAIISRALIKILEVTGYDCGLISMLNPDTNQLEVAVHHNLPEPLLEIIEIQGLKGTLCEYVHLQNKTLIVENIDLEASTDLKGLTALGLRSYYGTPIQYRGISNGTICLFGKQPKRKQESAAQIMLAASQQIGVAVKNTHLYQKTQEALIQSEALYQGSERIIRSESAQPLLEAIVESTPAGKFDHALLVQFDQPALDEKHKLFTVTASWVQSPLDLEFSSRFVNDSIDLILELLDNPNYPVFIPEISAVDRIAVRIRNLMSEQLGIRSLAIFPLVVMHQFLGAVVTLSEKQVYISEREIRQTFSLTNQAAIVLQSLKLRNDLENQLSEMENIQRTLNREAWITYLSKADRGKWGYEFDFIETKPLSSDFLEMIEGGISSDGPDKPNSRTDTFTAPIEVQGETIGGLGVFEPGSYMLSEEEQNFLQSSAEQIAQALERARLIEQTQKTALELQTVASVSSASSAVLDPEELLQSVVDLAKNSFGLYHAHLYLFDDAETELVLAAGAGEIGRQMTKEGWVILLADDSIVARAATTRQGQIVNDVYENPNFLSNPLLPLTKSELAVPMIVGQQLLGVFDVQSDKVNNFSDDDLATFTTLATQTAVALQNARLFAEQSVTVERLRELDHLKTSFLANMSHELRTPLNSILGFAQVILEGIDGPLTDYMISDLQLIEKNGKHLLNLINEVLDMAKIEAGRMSLTIETVDLRDLLEDVLETTSAQARDKGIYLNLDADPMANLVISGDQIRLKQIMLNLVGNSIKFTEFGGVTVKIERQMEIVNIRVIDTGIGIAPDKLESIFEAFSQVDTSTTRKASGTGLGLPISRRLVEMHGGKLWAESNGDEAGTTMHLALPVHAKV
jgi:PAS domain S-box-containing protein